MAWIVGTDGFPTNDLFPNMPTEVMTKPYPKALWRIEQGENNGFPYHELYPEVDTLGAFSNAVRLRKISIPPSVKKIGRYAFTNTQLTEVTIARDCEYYNTSFPRDCTINFYPS